MERKCSYLGHINSRRVHWKQGRTLAVCSVILGVAVACESSPRVKSAPVGGNAFYSAVPTPSVLTTGTYDASDVYSNAGMAEQKSATSRKGPAYRGTINGITVDPDYVSPECAAGLREMTQGELAPYAIPTPGWLPPGAVEEYLPAGMVCEEDVRFVARRFRFNPYPVEAGIWRLPHRTVFDEYVTTERVDEGEVAGRRGIFVRPWTAAGAGNSYIVLPDGGGLLVFAGVDLRFEDLEHIAGTYPYD